MDLPKDLFEAESYMHKSVINSLNSKGNGLWQVTFKFEGLRIAPIAQRFKVMLDKNNIRSVLVWPDAGAVALAKRDYSEISNDIYSINSIINNSNNEIKEALLIVVTPTPSDYDEFEKLCVQHGGPIIMINGRLEDPIVGIGSVARKRRKQFLSLWQISFWLQPFEEGALMKCTPSKWMIYKSGLDGYRYIEEFNDKPSPEIILETMLSV